MMATDSTSNLSLQTLLAPPSESSPSTAERPQDDEYEDEGVYDDVRVTFNHYDDSVGYFYRNLRKPSTWGRLLLTIVPQKIIRSQMRRARGFATLHENSCSRKACRAYSCRSVCVVLFIVLAMMQVISILLGILAALFPDHINSFIEDWSQLGKKPAGLASWPTDFTRDILPLPCHSHNDYWRQVPLYSAVSAGCTGVEADVWHFDSVLYVGHTTSSLTPNRTLASLYINPLVEILACQNPGIELRNFSSHQQLNGVFDVDPLQTLTLLVDFKTPGLSTWPAVRAALEPLRSPINFLTHFNGTHIVSGPITVVGTGNCPFDLLIENENYRDIFFDAPLDDLWKVYEVNTPPSEEDGVDDMFLQPPTSEAMSIEDFAVSTSSTELDSQDRGQGHTNTPSDPSIYNPSNSYYASVDFKKSVGRLYKNHLSPKQMAVIRGQIREAHRRGLKARYWGTPSWPRSYRDHVWHVLLKEGVDMLNVDDLKGVGEFEAKSKRLGWF